MKAMLGSKYGYMVNGKWEIGNENLVVYDPYIWLEYVAGTTTILSNYYDGNILNTIDDIKVNDVSVTISRTVSALKDGDVVKIKFKIPHQITWGAFYNLNVKKILQWPTTGKPIILGTPIEGYDPPTSSHQTRCRVFQGCGKIEYIADSFYGFNVIGNDAFQSSRSVYPTDSVITLAPTATEFGKYVFRNFNSPFRFNYNATNIPDTGRVSDFSYYPWCGEDGSHINMYVGDNVEHIPCYMFLKNVNVYIKRAIPPTLSSNVGNSCSIHVPAELVDTYKAAWSSLSSKITGDYHD